MNKPRLIQTYLTDGTLEGIRVVDPEGDVEAYVIPRLKLAEAKNEEKLLQPALYILLNAEDNRAYIGESESFLTRATQHLKSKDWWTLAVAIVSKTNDLEKGDVKYLESLAVERTRGGSTTIENSTIPPRNNIHKFKVHKLDKILDDTQLVLTTLGYDILSLPQQKNNDQVWHLSSRGAHAQGEYRGDQFIVLAGSSYGVDRSNKWAASFPNVDAMRRDAITNKSVVNGDTATLTDNIAFKSVSLAAGFVTGGFVNGWKVWKDSSGKTMDEIIRGGLTPFDIVTTEDLVNPGGGE